MMIIQLNSCLLMCWVNS